MAIYEVTLWSIEYAENKDQVFVSIQTYNHDLAAKYPTFSICFRGTKFHWYRDVNIFNSYGIDPYQYELMLKGETAIKYELNDSTGLYDKIAISSENGVDVKFNEFHVRLEDVLKDLRHRLVDGFNPVSQGKLINNLLVWFFKVNFPALFSLRVGQPNFTTVLLAQVVEEVLVKTRVLCVIGGDLQMKG